MSVCSCMSMLSGWPLSQENGLGVGESGRGERRLLTPPHSFASAHGALSSQQH